MYKVLVTSMVIYENELHTSIIDFSCVKEFSFSHVSPDPFLMGGQTVVLGLNIRVFYIFFHYLH